MNRKIEYILKDMDFCLLLKTFLFFAKSLSNKYSQKLLHSAKKIYNRCNRNCIKKSNLKKTVEATRYLIGNKIVDKTRSALKNLLKNYEMMKQK